jgi:uracil-DNA glycosylase
MNNKIIFITEAWNEVEEQYASPLIGSAGQELYRCLHKTRFVSAPLDYRECSPLRMMRMWTSSNIQILSVFNARPGKESNDVQLFYASLRDNIPVDKSLPSRKVGSSNFHCRADTAHHVHTLHDRLRALQPNLIIPLGATATWALGLGPGISKLRGFVHQTEWGKCLPVYHPGAVLAKWPLRVPLLMDLTKARRECEFPEIRRVSREIWTEPSPGECYQWWEQHGRTASMLAFDIETERAPLQISEVGFASDPYHALHIPFVLDHKSHYNHTDEVALWKFVKMACESAVPKIGQNVIQYDSYWMLKQMGIQLRNVQHDTMILSHAWQPELGKSLYDLGAIFLDEASWKNIRKDSMKGKDND